MNEAEWREIEDSVAAAAPDRHVAAFFAPKVRRRALLAVYAFDQELAHIAEAVREPMLGHVRLAWWRERLAAIHDGAPQHAPTAKALAEAVRAHKLDRAPLEALIDARAHDFEETPFADEPAFERYAAATQGNVMRLAIQLLGVAEVAENAIRNAALAAALGAELRAAAHYANRRRYRLPLSWLAEQSLNPEDVFANPAAFARLKPRIEARIAEALAAANRDRLAAGAMPALSPATMARVREPSAWQRVTRIATATLFRRL